MITGVRQIVLSVEDQERAKEFWTETMGFDLVQDSPYGDERWLEVKPPDESVVLVLSPRRGGEPAREAEVSESLPHSNVLFDCDDIQATYEELAARGVDFPQPPTEQRWGRWAMFTDPDGTRYGLGERPS
jgi:lactoylglutathione lyase